MIIVLLDKVYLYVKDPNEAKYLYLIKTFEKHGIENLKNLKAFIEYLNNMQHVYKNIEEYNPGKKCNVLKVFDDMTADMISNKNLNQIVFELFIIGTKLSISTAFIL